VVPRDERETLARQPEPFRQPHQACQHPIEFALAAGLGEVAGDDDQIRGEALVVSELLEVIAEAGDQGVVRGVGGVSVSPFPPKMWFAPGAMNGARPRSFIASSNQVT
jgi:hypothetical protein